MARLESANASSPSCGSCSSPASSEMSGASDAIAEANARLPSAVPPAPRLNVGVFSKRKGVRYHRDGQVRSCRFCEILRARAEEFLFEDEHVVVFRPLRPTVASHILIVPRAHIRNVNRLATHHRELLERMKRVAETQIAQLPASDGIKPSAKTRRLWRRHGHGRHHEAAAEPQPEDPEPAAGEKSNVHEWQTSGQTQSGEGDVESALSDGAGGCKVRYSFHVPPFNSIDHVHMHAFRDEPATLGYLGRIKYRTESWWCRSYDEVVARLDSLSPVGAGPSSPDGECSSQGASSSVSATVLEAPQAA